MASDAFTLALRRVQAALSSVGGIAKVPLSDESLRPLVLAMWQLGREKGSKMGLMVFDEGNDPPNKLFMGVAAPVADIKAVAKLMVYLPEAELMPKKSVVISMTGLPGIAVAYFPHLYIPAGALGQARH